MKKADRLTRAISILLFAAMLCYMGFALWRCLARPVQTALAVEASLTDSVTMSGMVIREEHLVLSNRAYIDIIAADGEKIAAGGAVATAYKSPEALDRALRMHALERQLREAEEALAAQEDAGERRSVYGAVEALSAALRRGNYVDIDLRAEALGLLLGQGDAENLSGEYLLGLRREYESLAVAAGQDALPIEAEFAGTFSSILDGFESLTPEDAALLSPRSLQELMNAEGTVPERAMGKMIASHEWYYAAALPAEEAGKLTAGQGVSLSFGRYYAQPLEARVEQIGEAAGGSCVVLFRLDEALVEMLAVRKTSAELIYDSHEGLRVPEKGLWRYYAGYVAASEAAGLRPGDEVILQAGDLAAEAFVSELGPADEEGRCLAVFCWAWGAGNALPERAGDVLVTAESGQSLTAEDFYEDDPGRECLCVFTMTGLQAERKKVSLNYAGEEFFLVSSEGEDALRAGNEIIVQAEGLFHGRVFD